MRTVLYDGSFDHFLCAVFDVYDYAFADADICTAERFNGNLFGEVHHAQLNEQHRERVWAGLQKKLSPEALENVYRCFLSELPRMEAVLLSYIRYVFSSPVSIEEDYSHPAVLEVSQTARKVWREKHRMEAFVRFQKTKDNLYYALIDPDYNVLPLIGEHFQKRYADQCWLIYDGRRRYGMYYDKEGVQEVQMQFGEGGGDGKDITSTYDDKEEIYQQLWQQYFRSVNIPARKNTRLHLQHMPRRYWRYLTEKKV
jgi:probable DNA metabolism protein